MRGKVGLVIGLAAGYVLGTRAGRERYEQIKAQAAKVWNLDPVQEQVGKVKDFAKSSVMALPNALWDGAVKVTKAASSKGSAGQKLDAAIKTGKAQVDEVGTAANTSKRAVKIPTPPPHDADAPRGASGRVGPAADDAIDDISKAAADRNGA